MFTEYVLMLCFGVCSNPGYDTFAGTYSTTIETKVMQIENKKVVAPVATGLQLCEDAGKKTKADKWICLRSK